MLEAMRRIPAERAGISNTQWMAERAKEQADAINRMVGNLKYYDCPECNNKGYIAEADGDAITVKKCSCREKRRTLELIENSGLKSTLRLYSFDTYDTGKPWRKNAYEKALAYVEAPSGWWYMCGKPGTGKTHLCTAICSSFIDKGASVRYMVWRDDIPKLKAMIMDAEAYSKAMNDLKNADALYIDDFLKGDITKADINLAFELINARYIRPESITLISSERSIEDVLAIDEAIGSRIYERSKRNCIRTQDGNWRLTGG